MKCRVCGYDKITPTTVKNETHIKITYNNKNYYFCCKEHCSQYVEELKAIDIYYKERDDINRYVKENIMLYRDNQKLPDYFFDRLADLTNGTDRCRKVKREIKNGQRKGYPMPVILETFKSQRETILYWFRNKSFKNEQQKLNYMWRIIEGNINDEYEKWERNKTLIFQESKIDIDTMNIQEVLPTVIHENDSNDLTNIFNYDDI